MLRREGQVAQLTLVNKRCRGHKRPLTAVEVYASVEPEWERELLRHMYTASYQRAHSPKHAMQASFFFRVQNKQAS